MKKISILFLLLCSMNQISFSQEEKFRQFQLEADFNFSVIRPYFSPFSLGVGDNYAITSLGGNSYGLFIAGSFVMGKWFTDLDLNFSMTQNFQKIILADEPSLLDFNVRHNLNYFMPVLSVGRFFRFNEHFKFSLGLGFGYTFLLNQKANKNVDIQYDYYHDVDAIYEYDFNYSAGYRPTCTQATVGFYLPVGKNELVIKFKGSISNSTTIATNFRKVENYEAVEIFDDTFRISKSMLGVSIGYRFLGIKRKNKKTE